ncbi:MAG: hypothetical protein ACTHLY_14515 [Pseudolabrys sp.]
MIRHAFAAVLLLAVTATTTDAQVYGPFPPPTTATPLPTLPPSPTITTPLGTPVMAQPPATPSPPSSGSSFSDRATQCMQAGSAAGYGPNDLSGYTRACANSP